MTSERERAIRQFAITFYDGRTTNLLQECLDEIDRLRYQLSQVVREIETICSETTKIVLDER